MKRDLYLTPCCTLAPRYDDSILLINIEAFAPAQRFHSRTGRVGQRYLNVVSCRVDLSSELWTVLALVDEIENEDTVDASCDQLVLCVVEAREIDQP